MYTKDGIIQIMGQRNVFVNLTQVQKILTAIEEGKGEVSGQEFDELVRWEEDMKAYFVRRAEALGMTNVTGNAMSLS